MSKQHRPTRRDLIDAQRDIFRNQDEDERAGVTEETPGHWATHDRYYALAREVPVKEQRGVWDEAMAEHEKETDGFSTHPWVAYGRNHGGVWWHGGEAER